MRWRFIFITIIFVFPLWLGRPGFAATDSYYDYRNGQRYYCVVDGSASGMSSNNGTLSCSQGTDCPRHFSCESGQCVRRPLVCLPRCTARSSISGNCTAYGPDICGSAPYCSLNCVSRSSISGNCTDYGADACTAE